MFLEVTIDLSYIDRLLAEHPQVGTRFKFNENEKTSELIILQGPGVSKKEIWEDQDDAARPWSDEFVGFDIGFNKRLKVLLLQAEEKEVVNERKKASDGLSGLPSVNQWPMAG